MTREVGGGGVGEGERKLFSSYILLNKNGRNDAILQSNLAGRCQRIVSLRDDEHFALSLCVFRSCKTTSSWLVWFSRLN